jgi:hypothetical protein
MAAVNNVGDNVPSTEQQEQYLAQIKMLVTALQTFGTSLDAVQRQSYPRPRAGADRLFETVLGLAEEHKLNIPAMPLSEMRADVALSRFAEKAEEEIDLAHQWASDTRIAACGEAWQAFLGYYGLLSSMAARDSSIAKRLAPVTEFMARRRPQSQPPEQPGEEKKD